MSHYQGMEQRTKRRREESKEDAGSEITKRQKGGFRIGPDHLPDGTYRRRVQKIKSSLIDKAKIRKEYAKTKQQLQQQENDGQLNRAADATPDALPGMHPDRQILLEEQESQPRGQEIIGVQERRSLDRGDEKKALPKSQNRDRHQRQKPMPYARESRLAEQRQQEAEERQKAREEAARQRDQKIQERERFRKAMAKARQPGKDGKRRLGRESKLLLEKVQKMVSE